jgi:phenylacetate-CoA ligase
VRTHQVDDYFEPVIETLDRPAIEKLQERKLLELLPKVYAHSALVRRTWDAGGISPDRIKSCRDFLTHAPFIDKDSIRRYRDDHHDPCGGLLIADPRDVMAVGFSSGTTGDPTPVPMGRVTPVDIQTMRDFWHIGARPGDFISYLMFTFRGGLSRFSNQTQAGFRTILMPHDPGEIPLLMDALERFRPKIIYMVSSPMLIGLERYFELTGTDPREAFKSVLGTVFGGEPLSPRFAALVKDWGLELFELTSLGDVTGAMECREHNGMHAWEDLALVENLDDQGRSVPDGEIGEMVVTALDDPWAPLIRFRTGDLVRMNRERCACGRTHLRFWPVGRKGDQTIVQGRHVLPRDIQRLVEVHAETKTCLFQIIRPQTIMDALRLRVGYEIHLLTGSTDSLAARLAQSISAALGVRVEIELVPSDELLKLGPPQKIPRVTAK